MQLQRAHQQQKVVLQRYQGQIKKLSSLEATVRQQEKVLLCLLLRQTTLIFTLYIYIILHPLFAVLYLEMQLKDFFWDVFPASLILIFLIIS